MPALTQLRRSLIFWGGFATLSLIGTTAWAETTWEIVHVGTNKDGVYCVINAGSAEGLAIHAKICLQPKPSNSGADSNQQILCDRIVSIKQHVAAIQWPKLSPKQMQAIQPGTPVYWADKPQNGPIESKQESEINTKSEEQEEAIIDELEGEPPTRTQKADPTPKAISAPSWRRSRLALGGVYFASTPLQYGLPSFNATAAAQANAQVWEKSRTLASSPVGFLIHWEHPNAGPWSWGLQAGYSFIPKLTKADSFSITDPSQTLSSSLLVHLYRFGADVGYGLWRGAKLQVGTRAGVDIFRTTAKFSALQANTDVAKLAVSTLALAPKLGIDAIWPIANGTWALDTGMELSTVAWLQNSTSGNIDYIPTGSTIAQEKKTLGGIIGAKAGLGMSLRLGAGYTW